MLKSLSELEVWGVEQGPILYVGQLVLPMFLLCDGSLTPKKASLMVLVKLCDSLPILEKIFNLVR